MVLLRIFLCTLLVVSSTVFGCPENPVPPCTCRMIGFHACLITCVDVSNEVDLEKSLQSMRAATVPIKVVEIFESNFNYLPSRVFRGLTIPKLYIAGSSFVSLSDTEVGFVGLEDSLETLVVQECLLFKGWSWSHLRNLRAVTELRTVKAGMSSIDEDVREIAHLNITTLAFTQDSISYIHETAFATFHNLVTLSLKMNSIERLERSMFPNPAFQLRQIILSHNEIRFIPNDLFTNMPSLESLALADNKMISVTESVFKPVWFHLRKIDLTGNPLRCDCRMKWLLLTNFPKNTWVRCANPKALKDVDVRKLSLSDLWC